MKKIHTECRREGRGRSNMGERKAIIFDCDGTLLDSEKISIKTWELVCEPMGYEVPIEVLLHIRGRSIPYGRKCLFEAMGEDFPLDEIDAKRKIMNEELFYASENIVKPGVKQLLIWLKENQILTAVASAKAGKFTSDHLKHAGIYSYFDVVMGGDMVERNKPDPDLFLKAAEKMGVKSENCMVIGDALSDILAAKAAGMRSVFVQDLVPANDEIRNNVWKMVKQIDEIIPYI